MTAVGEDCAEHGEVGEELRLLALALLDRFEPGVRSVLAGLRVEAEAAAPDRTASDRTNRPTRAHEPANTPAACQWCPLCSVIALVRGDRPELGGRVAEHAEGLLTALRAVLAQPAAEPPAESQQPRESRPPRVQRIEVRRTDDGTARPVTGMDGGC